MIKKPHSNKPNIESWKVLQSKYLVKDPWLTLRVDKCRTPSGMVVEPYYVFEYTDWAHIAAFNDEDQILLIEQYRHGIGQVCLELPGGCVDPDDSSPQESVCRELLEETGYAASRVEPVASYYANPSSHNNMIHLFAGFGLSKKGEQNLDHSEDIHPKFFDIPTILELIDTGHLQHLQHIAGILLALRHFGKG